MKEKAVEKRIVSLPGGPAGPFYGVVTSTGRVVAMQIPDRQDADDLAAIPELKEQLAQARAAIKAVEWVGTPGNEYCPWCGASKSGGHDYRCPRQQAMEGREQ